MRNNYGNPSIKNGFNLITQSGILVGFNVYLGNFRTHVYDNINRLPITMPLIYLTIKSSKWVGIRRC